MATGTYAYQAGRDAGYDHANYVTAYGGSLELTETPSRFGDDECDDYADGWSDGVADYLEEYDNDE